MATTFIEDEEYQGKDFGPDGLPPGHYEQCNFVNCNLAGIALNAHQFTECTFIECDLSNVRIQETAFQDVRFVGCRMLGLQFEEAHKFLFAVEFEGCKLDHSSFFGRKLTQCSFRDCSLRGVDFANVDLHGKSFDGCELGDATFENTNLEKVDFRQARDYRFDPAQNRVKGAQFSREGLPGLLDHFDIRIG